MNLLAKIIFLRKIFKVFLPFQLVYSNSLPINQNFLNEIVRPYRREKRHMRLWCSLSLGGNILLASIIDKKNTARPRMT